MKPETSTADRFLLEYPTFAMNCSRNDWETRNQTLFDVYTKFYERDNKYFAYWRPYNPDEYKKDFEIEMEI